MPICGRRHLYRENGPDRPEPNESCDVRSLSTIDATKDVMVDKAKVVKTDIQISNGVIHVIDEVLMPPAHQSQPQGKKRASFGRSIHIWNASVPIKR